MLGNAARRVGRSVRESAVRYLRWHCYDGPRRAFPSCLMPQAESPPHCTQLCDLESDFMVTHHRPPPAIVHKGCFNTCNDGSLTFLFSVEQ